MGWVAQILGREPAQPKGYYKESKQYYQPVEAKPVKTYARDGYGGIACERVTPLTARTPIQWLGTMTGVFIAGIGVFVGLAILKKDEKFKNQFIEPAKKMFS